MNLISYETGFNVQFVHWIQKNWSHLILWGRPAFYLGLSVQILNSRQSRKRHEDSNPIRDYILLYFLERSSAKLTLTANRL